MVFHWCLSDSKSPQVFRTRLRILAVLSNAVVWIVSTRPLTSKSTSPFNSPFVYVPNAPITIGIIVTFMFHTFFNSLARSRYLSFFSLSFSFIQPGQQSPQFCKFFFFLIIIRSGLLAEIRWSVCIITFIIYSFRVFYISVSWLFFTGVWVTASPLKSPGLISGFWPFLAMLSFG